ncbi:MAG: hypothetical protein DRI57_33475 [Deltaproteobacteria bacterium]|nr:MAG: hypothetical protein DRI57_33475 [Deltaproteobacteria bacterium]
MDELPFGFSSVCIWAEHHLRSLILFISRNFSQLSEINYSNNFSLSTFNLFHDTKIVQAKIFHYQQMGFFTPAARDCQIPGILPDLSIPRGIFPHLLIILNWKCNKAFENGYV